MPIEVAAPARPEITLDSTTESQAELDHATGPNWREHFDPEKAKATAETKTEDKTAEAPKADATKTAPDSEAGKAASKEVKESEEEEVLPKGVQKRLDRLTARLKAAEDALKESRKTAKPEAAADGKKPEAASDSEPQQKDFKSWEEWNQAHTRWAVRDEQRQLAAKEQKEAAEAESKASYDSHLQRLESARTTHADFDDAIKAMPQFTFASASANQAFQIALIEADNGPELMYHLANHPEDMEQFAGKSATKVQMLVGQLSAKLVATSSSSAATEKTSSTEKEKEIARTTKHVSKAPPPPTPVKSSSATAPTALDDPKLISDTDAWIARRKQQQATKRRH